jgi:hypothetical protein
MKRNGLLLALLPLLPIIAAAADTSYDGTFALQGGTPQTAAHLLAPQIGTKQLERRLDAWMTPIGSATPIRSYQIDMTKYLHMIVISDDFRTFLHVHPKLGPDGHFLLDQTFPVAARYHIYIDAHPENIGQQVFRFDLNLGGPPGAVSRDLSEVGTKAAAGPYTVSVSSDVLSAQGESRIVVHVLEGGKPATDLHPYLGALAHAVFINAEDLSYVHAHPMAIPAAGAGEGGPMMNSAEAAKQPELPDSAVSSPNMLLHIALHEPGTYKLWFQFRGGKNLYVAPFIFTAR